MLLGILGIIALTVGTVKTSLDLAETQSVALEETKPAVVQMAEPASDPDYPDPDMGL